MLAAYPHSTVTNGFSAPQTRTIRVFLLVHLAPIVQHRQAALHVVELAGVDHAGIACADKAHLVDAGASQRLFLHALRWTPREALVFDAGTHVLEHSIAPVGENHSGAQCAFDGGGREIRTAGSGREGRDVQAVASGAIPVGGAGGVFEWNAAAGKVLRETAPACEVQLLGVLELVQVAFQTRPFGEQPEDAPLVEDVDVVLPDHVVDGRQLFAIAHQDGRQTSEPVSHEGACGIGIATAKPAR